MAAVLVGVPLLWQGIVVLSEGFFWQDDFRYVIRAIEAPFSLGMLFADYSGHVMPGQFLLVWLVTAIAPLNFAVAFVPVLALQGLASWMFWRLLTRLFGGSWLLLVPLAAFTFSPLILVTTRWWAFALQLVPMLVAMIGAIDAQVRHVRTGRWRDLGYSLLWVLAGMLFWQKALLIAPVLVAVTALIGGLRTRRPSLVAHVALAVLLAGGYALLNETDVSGQPTAAGDWLRLAVRMVADTFVPGLLGGPWSVVIEGETVWAVPSAPVRFGLFTVAAVIVAAGLWVGRGRAALAWLTLAGYLAAAVAMVGVARLWVIGSVIGGDPRYVADAVPIAILCACFAFQYPKRPVRLAAPAVAAVLVVASIATTVTATARSDQPTSRAYTETLREELRLDPDVVLYDQRVPVELMNLWLGSLANVSQLVKTMPGAAPRFDEPAEDMRIVDDHGRLRPLAVLPTSTGSPGTTANCGHALPVEIALTTAVSGRQVLRISYFTGAPGDGEVRVNGRRIPVRWEPGVHNLHVVVNDLFDRITLTGVGVCVGEVLVGVPVPQ